MGFMGHKSVDVEKIYDAIIAKKNQEASTFSVVELDIPEENVIDRAIIDNNIFFLVHSIQYSKRPTTDQEWKNYNRMVSAMNFLRVINTGAYATD